MFASGLMSLVLKRRVGRVLRIRLSPGSGTTLRRLRAAAAWSGRTLADRRLLVVAVVLTLAAYLLPCLPVRQDRLELTPCYLDVFYLPGKFVQGVLQTVVSLAMRVVAELLQ